MKLGPIALNCAGVIRLSGDNDDDDNNKNAETLYTFCESRTIKS